MCRIIKKWFKSRQSRLSKVSDNKDTKMFLDKDLIGEQQDIELFNNIGNLDNLEGRLTVLLTINPTPRLNWEFEAARGDYTHDSLSFDSPPNHLTSWNEANPQFILENPKFTFRGGSRRISRGYAEQALYGDIDADAHYFEFYLPNTDFLRDSLGGELGKLTDVLRILNCESFKAEIGNDWSVELITDQKALDWLKPKVQNRGSMITLKIRLFQTQQSSKRIQDLLITSLADSRKIISDLCLMLSYANGGYIKSVYTIAKKFSNNEINSTSTENVASLAEAPIISPQEELGGSFIRYFGITDLLDFIKCFPTFQKMLQTPHWQEKWIVILEWYFQAILKPSGRRRNALIPVVANALGTLLENLARIILVREGRLSNTQFENISLKNRIEHLHIRLGISGDTSVIEDFVKIRNNSTHAKSNPIPLDEIQQWEVVLKAVQWVDEVILWRLGYGGQYLERNLQSVSGINPRYDLSLRDSSW